ncbi:MAG: DoxX family protein [Actinomycetota bacterium]
MDLLMIAARILLVPIFLASGMGHLTATEAMAGYAASKGIPSPTLAVRGSGVLILLGGLSVLLGIYPEYGALALVLFSIPTAFLMHAFWRETDPMAKMNERVHFLKDLALAGAGLFAYALVVAGEFGPTLVG